MRTRTVKKSGEPGALGMDSSVIESARSGRGSDNDFSGTGT